MYNFLVFLYDSRFIGWLRSDQGDELQGRDYLYDTYPGSDRAWDIVLAHECITNHPLHCPFSAFQGGVVEDRSSSLAFR